MKLLSPLCVCACAAVLPALFTTATLISSSKITKKQAQKPLVTQTAAFETAEEACCACFGSKYDWPSEYATIESCDTCYVHDAWGIAAKDAESATKDDGLGGSYETTDQSEVKGVHEWNWNCASGNAPETPDAWASGPVEGEPSKREAFMLCKESAGWHCPKIQKRLAAGGEKPQEDESAAPGDKPTVETMTLPKLGF